jgi:hypothetical protein
VFFNKEANGENKNLLKKPFQDYSEPTLTPKIEV